MKRKSWELTIQSLTVRRTHKVLTLQSWATWVRLLMGNSSDNKFKGNPNQELFDAANSLCAREVAKWLVSSCHRCLSLTCRQNHVGICYDLVDLVILYEEDISGIIWRNERWNFLRWLKWKFIMLNIPTKLIFHSSPDRFSWGQWSRWQHLAGNVPVRKLFHPVCNAV